MKTHVICLETDRYLKHFDKVLTKKDASKEASLLKKELGKHYKGATFITIDNGKVKEILFKDENNANT